MILYDHLPNLSFKNEEWTFQKDVIKKAIDYKSRSNQIKSLCSELGFQNDKGIYLPNYMDLIRALHKKHPNGSDLYELFFNYYEEPLYAYAIQPMCEMGFKPRTKKQSLEIGEVESWKEEGTSEANIEKILQWQENLVQFWGENLVFKIPFDRLEDAQYGCCFEVFGCVQIITTYCGPKFFNPNGMLQPTKVGDLVYELTSYLNDEKELDQLYFRNN